MTTLAERRAALRRVSAERRLADAVDRSGRARPEHGEAASRLRASSAHGLNRPQARERNDDDARSGAPRASRPHRSRHARCTREAHRAGADRRAWRSAAGRERCRLPAGRDAASVDGPGGAGHHADSSPGAPGPAKPRRRPRSADRAHGRCRHPSRGSAAGRRRCGKRTPASEPTTELELADALFETLYREGVDLSWP